MHTRGYKSEAKTCTRISAAYHACLLRISPTLPAVSKHSILYQYIISYHRLVDTICTDIVLDLSNMAPSIDTLHMKPIIAPPDACCITTKRKYVYPSSPTGRSVVACLSGTHNPWTKKMPQIQIDSAAFAGCIPSLTFPSPETTLQDKTPIRLPCCPSPFPPWSYGLLMALHWWCTGCTFTLWLAFLGENGPLRRGGMSSISTVSKAMVGNICGRLSGCMRSTVSVAYQYSIVSSYSIRVWRCVLVLYCVIITTNTSCCIRDDR